MRARSSEVPWLLSPPSGACESKSGQRAGTPASLSRSWAQGSPSSPATWPCPHYLWLHRSRYLAMGPGRRPEELGWEPADRCARLPHPRHPQKGTNKKANTPEAGPATYDATRNEQGLFFVGAQLLPRRRRQRSSPLGGQQPRPQRPAPRLSHRLLPPPALSLGACGAQALPSHWGARAVGAAQGRAVRVCACASCPASSAWTTSPFPPSRPPCTSTHKLRAQGFALSRALWPSQPRPPGAGAESCCSWPPCQRAHPGQRKDGARGEI